METSSGRKILIVEDETDVADLLTLNLRKAGYRISTAADGAIGLQKARDDKPDLIILDLMLPKMSGLEVCKILKGDTATAQLPILMLTARAEEIDRIVGLEFGADDYVTKPFNLRELLARVRAIIRRLDRVRAAPAREPERGGYRFSGWQLSLRTRRLTDPKGADVALTKGEYALLVAFLDGPQRTLSREHLLQATRVHEDVFDRSIDVQILRLRRKLEHDPSAPQIIQTERGFGYVFARQVERF